MNDSVDVWTIALGVVQSVCALLGLAIAVLELTPRFRRALHSKIAGRPPKASVPSEVDRTSAHATNAQLPGDAFSDSLRDSDEVMERVGAINGVRAADSAVAEHVTTGRGSLAFWLCGIGFGLAAVCAIYLQSIGAVVAGESSNLIAAQVALALLAGVAVAVAPRRPQRGVFYSLVVVGYGGTIVSGLMADQFFDGVEAVARGFVPIAAVSIAVRLHDRVWLQAAIFAISAGCVIQAPIQVALVLVAALALSLTTGTRGRLVIWLLPLLAVALPLIIFRTHRLSRVEAWINPERGDELGALYQVEQYRLALGSAALVGPSGQEWVVQMSRVGWLVGLAMHTGLLVAILLCVAIGASYLYALRASWRSVRERSHAFALNAVLFPLLLINVGIELGLLPTFALTPPPFASLASGIVWLSLAWFSLRWPVFTEISLPGRAITSAQM